MKKGFILALLMVAMVAVVLPVSARAPIVNPLPTIIIGDTDAGDSGTSGTLLGIMRYTNALDLMDPTKIDWNNPTDVYTSASYHAYLVNLGTPVPNILPYNAAGGIDLATSTELTNLLATGATPAASARLTSPGAATYMLSLYDETRMGTLADPMGANPLTDGVPVDTYSANTTLVFVAAVEATESHSLAATDLGTTSTADSISPIKVICQSGGTDSKAAPKTDVVLYTFEGSAEGWLFTTLAPYPSPVAVGGTTADHGIGFNIASAAPSGLATHGVWASPATISGSSENQGRVYRAAAHLTCTSTGSDTSVGWRLTFRNIGFSHFGKVSLESIGAEPTGEKNRPVGADTAPTEVRLYWVAPYFLGDMGDGEGQSLMVVSLGPPVVTQDARKYKVTFDALGTTGDTGQLMMEDMDISYILRPMDMDAVVAWGTGSGETNFDEPAGSGGWKTASSQAGFANGVTTPHPGDVVMNIGGTSGLRYTGTTSQDFDIVTYPYLPVNQLLPVSNHLYRFSVSLSCASRATVPTYRCIINGWNRVPVDPVTFNVQTTARKMIWVNFFAYSNWVGIGKQQYYIWPAQDVSPLVCPGAPSSNASAPTRLEVYVWSHSVAPQTPVLVSTMFPILDLVDVGLFGSDVAPPPLWQDPHGNMTFTSAQWEDLGQDW
jgi:hypothetical protein